MRKILREYSASKIINSGETTRSELEFLAKKIGLDVKVNWLKDHLKDPNTLQILNIGNPNISGTHWIGLYQNKYFDPFGLPPAIPGVEWVPFQIQSIRSGHCGTYALMWLYYAYHNEIDKFYNLFRDVIIDKQA